MRGIWPANEGHSRGIAAPACPLFALEGGECDGAAGPCCCGASPLASPPSLPRLLSPAFSMPPSRFIWRAGCSGHEPEDGAQHPSERHPGVQASRSLDLSRTAGMARPRSLPRMACSGCPADATRPACATPLLAACRKVGKAYFALLDVLCHNHSNVIATRDTSEHSTTTAGGQPGGIVEGDRAVGSVCGCGIGCQAPSSCAVCCHSTHWMHSHLPLLPQPRSASC